MDKPTLYNLSFMSDDSPQINALLREDRELKRRREEIKAELEALGEDAKDRWYQQEGDWSLIRDHIETVLASGNAEFSQYLIRWIAWSIQNPDKQAEVAVVLIGARALAKAP